MTAIEAQYAALIHGAARRFADHENMSRRRISEWMAQFANPHVPLSGKILENVTYFNAAAIRAMTSRLAAAVREKFPGVESAKIIFIPVGDPGSSSNVIARALRDVPNGPRPRIISMADLERTDPATVSVIVFIDDFSGTGDQLVQWWENVEPLVRPKGASIAVALLVMNAGAREKIEKFAGHALCVEELDERANVLSERSLTFDDGEKRVLLDYCQKTGCRPAFLRGYGSCGLLLAFKHGCPNNSLPILWFESKSWQRLFRRSAI